MDASFSPLPPDFFNIYLVYFCCLLADSCNLSLDYCK